MMVTDRIVRVWSVGALTAPRSPEHQSIKETCALQTLKGGGRLHTLVSSQLQLCTVLAV